MSRAERDQQPAQLTVSRQVQVSEAQAAPVQARGLWLALRFPELPLRALGSCVPGSPPRVVAERVGARPRVLLGDAAARASGVEVGMSVSAACSVCPRLIVLERDPRAERSLLEGMAAWACRHTSLVSLQPPLGLLLEVGGSLTLFGGLGALLARIRRDLSMLHAGAGEVEMGLAPTPTAAWMLALTDENGGVSRTVTVPERLVDHLAPLPLSGLQLDGRTLDDLQVLGLRCVGDCLRLPREDLARRFSTELLAQLDRACGRVADPRPPWRAPEVFQRRLDLSWGTRDRGVLLEGGRQLLLQLGGYLRARAVGARRVEFRIAHAGGRATALTLELVSLNRDPQHLLGLLAERLERVELPSDALHLGLRVSELAPLAPSTADLYEPRPLDTDLSPAQLVERLQARLGRDRVHGLLAVADPRPERMSRTCVLGERGRGGPAPEFGAAMPVWLLPSPRALSSRHGQPCHGGGVLVVESGAQRIEAGWWDGEDVARDYYVALAPTGARYWVFRRCRPPHDWYLHGVFA